MMHAIYQIPSSRGSGPRRQRRELSGHVGRQNPSRKSLTDRTASGITDVTVQRSFPPSQRGSPSWSRFSSAILVARRPVSKRHTFFLFLSIFDQDKKTFLHVIRSCKPAETQGFRIALALLASFQQYGVSVARDGTAIPSARLGSISLRSVAITQDYTDR